MKRAYTDIPEGQVHYRTEGTGFPLLLLHQSVCSSDEYSRVIPFLSKDYHVIAMDTLGFGESDKPPRPYKIPDYARSVVSFLDALGIDEANVVGHHTGASIAVELAAAYPQRVHKLVLSGCPFDIERNCSMFPSYAEAFAWYAKAFKPLEITADGAYMQQVWEKLQLCTPEDRPDIRYEVALEYFKAGARGEEAHWASTFFDTRPRLPLIKCPTLLLSGRNDVLISVLEEVKELIPGAKSLIIEGERTGIPILRESPQAFAEAVLEFQGQPER
jgi:pimeloyl-ACP methyl ester carboxylesterase